MKSGRRALALHLAVTVPEPLFDVTYLFYDCEEIEADAQRAQPDRRSHPDWLEADFAILLEPTYGLVEAGCQGTMRAVRAAPTGSGPTRPGPGAGSTRSTRAGAVLRRLEDVRGAPGGHRRAASYREGLNAVRIRGGVRRQRDPGPVRDRGQLPVRARTATRPRRRRTCARCSTAIEVEIVDAAAGALPGLDAAAGAGVPERDRAAADRPSSAGPTWRGSRPSASRR